MIYFPENENDEINNGTTFWNSKIKNFGNKHINNQKDLDLFLKQSNKIYETPFEKMLYMVLLKTQIVGTALIQLIYTLSILENQLILIFLYKIE